MQSCSKPRGFLTPRSSNAWSTSHWSAETGAPAYATESGHPALASPHLVHVGQTFEARNPEQVVPVLLAARVELERRPAADQGRLGHILERAVRFRPRLHDGFEAPRVAADDQALERHRTGCLEHEPDSVLELEVLVALRRPVRRRISVSRTLHLVRMLDPVPASGRGVVVGNRIDGNRGGVGILVVPDDGKAVAVTRPEDAD